MPHSDRAELDKLFVHIREYQALAEKHGINDIFQDNGGKTLQVLLVTGLKILPGREGNDAVDELGREYEMKSLNMALTKSFSTHHHLNHNIIEKYRGVDWIFAVYSNILLTHVYKLTSDQLECFFKEWEEKLNNSDRGHINNPKIRLRHVQDFGKLLYCR